MGKHKSPDSRGVVAELAPAGVEGLRLAIAELSTDILNPEGLIPDEWRRSCLKLILKMGEPTCPENYRPIAALPILSKLFSKVICARVQATVIEAKSVDQAGFRPGFSCEDHLFAVTLLAEIGSESTDHVTPLDVRTEPRLTDLFKIALGCVCPKVD